MGGSSKIGQPRKARRWGTRLKDFKIESRSSECARRKNFGKHLKQQKYVKRRGLAPKFARFKDYFTLVFQLPNEDDSTSVTSFEYSNCIFGENLDNASEPSLMDEATATRLKESDRA